MTHTPLSRLEVRAEHDEDIAQTLALLKKYDRFFVEQNAQIENAKAREVIVSIVTTNYTDSWTEAVIEAAKKARRTEVFWKAKLAQTE